MTRTSIRWTASSTPSTAWASTHLWRRHTATSLCRAARRRLSTPTEQRWTRPCSVRSLQVTLTQIQFRLRCQPQEMVGSKLCTHYVVDKRSFLNETEFTTSELLDVCFAAQDHFYWYSATSDSVVYMYCMYICIVARSQRSKFKLIYSCFCMIQKKM